MQRVLTTEPAEGDSPKSEPRNTKPRPDSGRRVRMTLQTRGSTKNGRTQQFDKKLQSPSTTNGEESGPVKPRIPHAKSSLGEMNKRVKQLSDYITRLQVSMAAESPLELPTIPSPSPSVKSSDASGTLSTLVTGGNIRATLVTGGNACRAEVDVGQPQETSLEMLDRLNRSLIKFQERFSGHGKK